MADLVHNGLRISVVEDMLYTRVYIKVLPETEEPGTREMLKKLAYFIADLNSASIPINEIMSRKIPKKSLQKEPDCIVFKFLKASRA